MRSQYFLSALLVSMTQAMPQFKLNPRADSLDVLPELEASIDSPPGGDDWSNQNDVVPFNIEKQPSTEYGDNFLAVNPPKSSPGSAIQNSPSSPNSKAPSEPGSSTGSPSDMGGPYPSCTSAGCQVCIGSGGSPSCFTARSWINPSNRRSMLCPVDEKVTEVGCVYAKGSQASDVTDSGTSIDRASPGTTKIQSPQNPPQRQ